MWQAGTRLSSTEQVVPKSHEEGLFQTQYEPKDRKIPLLFCAKFERESTSLTHSFKTLISVYDSIFVSVLGSSTSSLCIVQIAPCLIHNRF